MPRKGYRGISLPETMIEEIEKLLKQRPDLGYQSVAEFIKDAIRRRIEELKKEMTFK